MAAVVAAASERAIIFGHLLPSFLSYVIVSLTLAVPGMILGETALSFLGLGIQPPAVSWGTLLQDAQNFQAVSRQPWLLIPCLFVVLTVLLYNFLGDGMRGRRPLLLTVGPAALDAIPPADIACEHGSDGC